MISTPATLTVLLVDGTRVVVPDSLEQITPYVLQEQGDWFEDEIRFLRRLVQPGRTVVDIGANVGVYALSLARKVGPSGQVWAFEPAAATAALLAESIAANGTPWLQLQRQALSDHSGSAWLQTSGQSELNSLAADPQGPGEEVPLTTLDACLEAFAWQQVDLLKIDAEGEEERILAGGRRFFAELTPLVMFELKAGTELHLELVERFGELGYRCYRLVPGLDVLMPFDPAAGVDGYLLNLFAAKPDRAEALAASGWLVPTASPAPPDPAELAPYHWRRVLTQLPYGQALAASWEEQEASQTEAAAEPLALWAYAQDTSQPIAQRLGALQRSYALLSEQARDKQRLTSLSSLARVAAELGERTEALRALGHLIPALEAGVEPEATESFLPPCARFDRLDPQGRLAAWLNAAALESDELLGHYSSFFSGIKARPRLERLQELGFSDQAIQQRLTLFNRRFPPRQPASPEMECPNPKQITCGKEAWELIQAGHTDQGKARLAEAREMGDTCSKALHYMAKCTLALGNGQEAVEMLQRSIELDPHNPAAVLELGLSLKNIGEPKAAEAVIHQAVWLYGFRHASCEPSSDDLNNLGMAYHELGDIQQALECLDRALQIDPMMESALMRKAAILHNQQTRHDEVLEIWERLQERKPDDLTLMSNRASLLTGIGEVKEAIDLLNKVISHNPANRRAHLHLAFAHSIAGLEAVEAHLCHLSEFWMLQRASSQPSSSLTPRALLAGAQKLRVGFLSAELGNHVVSQFLEPFLTHYDRNRFEVELIEVHENRSRRALELAKLADAVITVQHLSLGEARHRIRSRGYDVIVETSGFTRDSGIEILADRCARVQCHYIGFHASTGLDTIDWFIGDQLTTAEDLADQYVEKLWRLPRLWLASRVEDRLPSAESSNQGSFPVLGSFNQFAKVRGETLVFWAAALRRIPDAQLHLKSYSTDSERPRRRILQTLERAGIDPSRITFFPRTNSRLENLECYRGIDVALDATPWAGATTTFDALSMGVPVVGILGATTAGRMTCSILRALGKEEWISTTPEEFAEAVEHLVGELARLRAGRLELQQQVLNSSLYDGADLARHLEDALRAMVSAARSQSTA
ncbi:MAG: FkbM family methyltransferase [Prochlorococcaceae cyanobacterium]